MNALESKILDILIEVDAAAASALFANTTDLTISSRCGMALIDQSSGNYSPDGPHGIEQRFLIALGNGLDDLAKQHCYESIVGDLQRAQTVVTTLDPYALVAQKILTP